MTNLLENNRAGGGFAEGLTRLLTERGALDAAGLQRAERAQQRSGERFDRVLTRLGLASERAVAEAMSTTLALPLMGEADYPLIRSFEAQLPLAYLKEHRILPLNEAAHGVALAMADPLDEETASAVAFLLERPVMRHVATAGDIDAAIERLHTDGQPADRGDLANVYSDDGSEDDVDRLKDIASEAPIIRLVQQVIARAVETEASDVHLEPGEDGVRVRYRLDGVLHTIETLPPGVRAAVTSRVKIMARLNIAERRLPQDGRIRLAVRGKDIDLRVSTMPTLYGEGVVLRILDRSTNRLDLEDLGFHGQVLDAFRKVLAQPNGIVLVTGPTGSGKTTTLYSALAGLNSAELKLFTVEDPIEYHLAGINQIQVQPKIGLTFAAALRSILRQDPDIIMIGEIRDLETAQIAIQASLTGHLVFSTVHTNSAAATVVRLLDMGIESYLLASSVTAVVSQRLVRKLCRDCASPRVVPKDMLRKLVGDAFAISDVAAIDAQITAQTYELKSAVGCASCRHTGYAGRSAVLELLEMTDGVKEHIVEGASEQRIEKAGQAAGMITMYRDGLQKVLAGETTLEEVLQVTRIR